MFYLVALVCGVIFGLGLAISRMINPAKVLNFFDVSGQWDPTLAFVFAGAVAVATPAYQWILRRRSAPVLDNAFKVPDNTAVTLKLVVGSAIFGAGWGIAGFCPGPGIAALATALPAVFIWVAALFAGAACYRFLVAR